MMSLSAEKLIQLLQMTPSDIRLVAGEMTAQEMRSVKAVLAYLERKVLQEHERCLQDKRRSV